MFCVYRSAETHDVMGNKNDTSSFIICSLMQKKPNFNAKPLSSHLLKVLCGIKWLKGP